MSCGFESFDLYAKPFARNIVKSLGAVSSNDQIASLILIALGKEKENMK